MEGAYFAGDFVRARSGVVGSGERIEPDAGCGLSKNWSGRYLVARARGKGGLEEDRPGASGEDPTRRLPGEQREGAPFEALTSRIFAHYPGSVDTRRRAYRNSRCICIQRAVGPVGEVSGAASGTSASRVVFRFRQAATKPSKRG